MKAMLLRVGIDKGTDGALAPIFEDGSFEFIPISEGDNNSKEEKTYENTIGRSGKSFSYYLPNKIKNRKLHFDPEFDTCTYGDLAPKRCYINRLNKGDLLVFYAGLIPYQNQKYAPGLYIIGYFTIDTVIDLKNMTKDEIAKCYHCYPNNAHLKRSDDPSDTIIVNGDKRKSNLLDKGILISQKKPDKNGRPYYAVSKRWRPI